MATFSSVTRTHVLQALAEYDARGDEQFLDVYGFAPSSAYPLVHEGRTYDSRAVLGVAHKFATGRLATAEEFSSGMESAVAILRKRGFEVTEPRVPPRAVSRAATTRAPRTATRTPSTRSPAAREATPAICPTCPMTLPATGICDTCS